MRGTTIPWSRKIEVGNYPASVVAACIHRTPLRGNLRIRDGNALKWCALFSREYANQRMAG